MIMEKSFIVMILKSAIWNKSLNSILQKKLLMLVLIIMVTQTEY